MPAPSSPSPSGVVTENLVVEGLEIEETRWKADGANWRLVLSWLAPPGLSVDHYRVTRDGVTVGVALQTTTFRDDDVEPGMRYRYSVTALDADGASTRAAVASIRTNEPSLAEARLEGSFAMRLTARWSKGIKDPVRGGAIAFSFDPSCRHGACSVRWTVRNTRAEGTLRRSRGVYSAKLRTPLFVRNCFGRPTDESLDVHLRVKAAAPIRRAWRVTKIEGSIHEVSSSPGCKTASIDWNVRGTLQN